VNWYNSLTSKGALNWNTGADLCEQTGVSCYGTSNVGLLYIFIYPPFIIIVKKEILILIRIAILIRKDSWGPFQASLGI